MPEIDINKIADQVNEIGAALTETRNALATKADQSILKEQEDRVIAALVPKLQELNKAEAEQRAAENTARKADDESFKEALLAKYDALETRMARFNGGGSASAEETRIAEHRKGMRSYMLSGEQARDARPYIPYLAAELGAEARTLRTDVDSKGGFLVDGQYEAEIIKNITLLDPIRSVARQTTLPSGDTLTLRKRTGIPTAYVVGQGARPSASQSTYGQQRIPTYWIAAETAATRDSLRDIPGFEQELMGDAAEAHAYKEGQLFVTGTGSNEPTGFTVNADVSQVTGTDASNDLLHPDDFPTLFTTIKDAYRRNATWGFNSTMLGKILKMKDQNDNYLLFMPNGIGGGIPNTILTRPYILIESMASDGTNGHLPLVFADWQKFYYIVDRQGIEVLRDEVSAKPDLEFDWYKRVGGDVYRAEAGKLIIV